MFDMDTHEAQCKSSQPTAVTPAVMFGIGGPVEFPPEYNRLVTARELAFVAFLLLEGGRDGQTVH